MHVAVTRATRHQRRLSIRLALLLLVAGGLVGWSVAVVAAYYVLRAYDGSTVQKVEQALGPVTPVNLRLFGSESPPSAAGQQP